MFFFIFYSIMVYHRVLTLVPCAIYARTSLFICSVYNSLYLLIPSSQSFPPQPFLPFDNHESVIYYCESVSVL